jgi:lactate dehydrogenase-like 2-hydroxyacid dehydrogenase
MLEELTGKTVLLVGHGAIGKEIERMLAPFHVEMCASPAPRAPSRWFMPSANLTAFCRKLRS